MLSLIEALPIILRVVQLAPQIQQALRLGQPALDASLAAARHGVVDQAISEHRVAEGPADERCHHRVSQGRVPLSQPKAKDSGHYPGDLFRARLDQIINMRHELVQLAGKIDWEFIDGEIAPLYSDGGRPGIATQFVIGLFLLKHIYGLSDEGVCERWVYDPYFQHFTGEEFFQHEFPHERSDLSHWRKRLGGKLELLLA